MIACFLTDSLGASSMGTPLLTSFFHKGTSLVHLLAQGGPAMIALLLCSAVAVYIFVFKLLYIRVNQVGGALFVARIKSQLLTDGIEKTSLDLKEKKGLVYQVLSVAIQNAQSDQEDLQTKVREATYFELPKLEQSMGVLSSIITAAPMLGLLGTVLGLISIFQLLSGGPLTNPSVLLGGISQALIATVTGLAIAIPCIFAHHYLTFRIDGFVRSIEQMTSEVLTFIKDSGSGVKP